MLWHRTWALRYTRTYAQGLYCIGYRRMPTLIEVLNQALAHHRANRLPEAEFLYLQILKVDPQQAETLHMLGALALSRGQLKQGITWMSRAVTVRPDFAGAWQNLSVAYQNLQQWTAAEETQRWAIRCQPQQADHYYHYANFVQSIGRLGDAAVAYRYAIACVPEYGTYYNNLGVILTMLGRVAEAIPNYWRSVILNDQDIGAIGNLASALRNSGLPNEALVLFRRTLTLDPAQGDVHYNLANLFSTAHRRGEALYHYRIAAALQPETLYIQRELIYTLLFGAHFDDAETVYERLVRYLLSGIATERDWRRLADLVYINLFCRFTDAQMMAIFRRLGELLPEEPGAMVRARAAAPLPPPGARLRIGFMSPNFGNHPVGHVTRSFFGALDRRHFEVFLFSLDDRSHEPESFNRDIRNSADHFHEVGMLDDAAVAASIRRHGVHILVDLNGIMTPKRTGILAHRAAPLQVYWLGHAGGLGVSGTDYLIADTLVLPPEDENKYCEKIIWLPECYHVADRPPIAATVPPRSAYGLAEDAFVFCAFNNPQKIDRAGFALWMAIMRQVPGSQLWLSGNDDPALVPNLRQAAADHGIDPERLVFATRVMDKDEHFARHAHADLFLDTFTLNASSTALDALWAGLPIITLQGAHFPSRIATSMMTAVGLTETIVDSPERYVAEAVALAHDPARLKAIRARLWANREQFPLFDVPRYAQHFGLGLLAIWQRYRNGVAPASVTVPAIDGRFPRPVQFGPGGTEAVLAPSVAERTRDARYYDVAPLADVRLDAVRHILVVKRDEIGDFLLATPFLRALRQSAPQAHIDLVVAPMVRDLAEICPHVNRVLSAEVEAGSGRVRFDAASATTLALFMADFQQHRIDLAIVPRFDFDRYSAGALAKASGAAWVVGYSAQVSALKAKRNAGFDQAFYTHVLTGPPSRHEVEQALALIPWLNGHVRDDTVEVWTTQEDARQAEILLDQHLPHGTSRELLVVCPGSSYPAKMFPLPRLTGIARKLQQERGCVVVVLGGAAEQEAGAALVAALPAGGAVSLCGQTSLRQSVEIIRRGRLLLSMCSAPGHIAAAVGTPVVVFLCHPLTGDPTHFHAPERFRPWITPRDKAIERLLLIQPENLLWPCQGSCEAPESHCIGHVQDAEVLARIAQFWR